MTDLEVTHDGVEPLSHATANRFYKEAVGLRC
jgi:hypothetical protein